MNKLPILFLRYAPGASGNLFISLLQTSSRISCWDLEVEQGKNTPEFVEKFKCWFEKCFQSDLENHLKHEPHHPYHLDFFSAKHPRGNEITATQFIDNLISRNDQRFIDNINSGKLTVLRLNKPEIPIFAQETTVVNVIVDPPSKKWFYQIRMLKLFGQDSQGWISKENHPEFLSSKFKKILFENQYCFKVSKFTFLKKFVVGEAAIRPFFKESTLLNDPSNKTCRQISLNLSVIFNQEMFVLTMIDLFQQLDLGDPDVELIKWAHTHYCHNNIDPFKHDQL